MRNTFLPFDPRILDPGDITAFDVFLGANVTPYAPAGRVWTTAALEEIFMSGVANELTHLSRQSREVNIFRVKKQVLSVIVGKPTMASVGELLTQKLSALRDDCTVTTELRAVVESAVEFSIDALTQDITSVHMMDELRQYDDYTHNHNARVGAYSVALALQMGIRDRELLRGIGIGGTMHDLGKMKVPLSILNKPGSLTPEEFDIIKGHPSAGAQSIERHYGPNSVVHDIISKHHEKLDGSGYPLRLHASEIPQHVRIATLADIYDALTTTRSYHDPRKSFDALQFIHQKMGEQVDANVLRHLVLLHAPKTR